MPSSDFTTPLLGTITPQGTVNASEAARLIEAEKRRRAAAAKQAEEDAAKKADPDRTWRRVALGASVMSSLAVGLAAIKYFKKM